MFPIAGQTAGPNGLKFVEGTHSLPGGAHTKHITTKLITTKLITTKLITTKLIFSKLISDKTYHPKTYQTTKLIKLKTY